MRPLSATEAIGPALDKTKAVLFAPFRKGRSWKLAATAHLSFMGCLFIPLPLAIFFVPFQPAIEGMSRTESNLILIGGLAGITAITSIFFYIGARLEFALFDIVLFKDEFVAPLWRKYRVHTRRWAGLKIAFATIVSTVIGLPLTVWFTHSFRQFPTQPGQPASPELMGSFFLLWLIAMGWICFFLLCSSLLGDFILPYIALEDVTLSSAIRAFINLFKTEPLQLIYFSLLKVVLAIAVFVLVEIATLIVELVAFIPLGIIGFLGWLILHQLGAVGEVLTVAGSILLELTGVAFIFYFLIGIQGCAITFFQAYALYFLGGRYPLLGDLLEPPAEAFATTPTSPGLPPMPLESGAL